MSQEDIIDKYMEGIESTGIVPTSIDEFCIENGIEEEDFHREFDSFKAIDTTIFLLFYIQTNQLLKKSGNFSAAEPKEKLLTFYFTFFEVLAANRPYVLVAFPTEINQINRLDILADLRKEFLAFAGDVFSSKINSEIPQLEKIKAKTYEEGTWAQLLFILNFWIRDNSEGNEKTDILIEKSLKATFDLVDITALKSIMDLGKFLYKEATT
ncbi:MAG: hypothetical protein ACI9IP_000664 [Arcticibacterium sp.]|jgi:hypothetical protein